MPPFIDEQRLPDTSNLNDDIQHTRNPELDGNDAEPIAIIGFSFKFPDDADTPEGFWDMLLEQRYTARKFPADRVNADGYYRKKNKNNSVSPCSNFIFDEVWGLNVVSLKCLLRLRCTSIVTVDGGQLHQR